MKFKQTLILVIVGLAISASALPGVASYMDVDEYSEHYKSISNFSSLGILKGFDDGSFRPEQNVTRAEALKILSLALDIKLADKNEITEPDFTDVKPEDWFYNYVQIGVNQDLIKGFEDQSFRPNKPILVAEIVKIALRAKGIQIDNPSNSLQIDEQAWYKDYMNLAYNNNFLSVPQDDPSFSVKPISRALAAEFLYRLKNSEESYKYYTDFKEFKLNSGFKVKLPEYLLVRNHGDGLIATGLGQGLAVLDNYGILVEASSKNHPKAELSAQAAKLKSDLKLSESFEQQKENFYLLTGKDEQQISRAFYIQDYKTLEIAVKINLNKRLVEMNKIVKDIFNSVELVPISEIEARHRSLELARKNILKSYTGMDTLKKFSDLELFYTDAVGLGTGPLDYYFDKDTNHTFKYERSFDVIMDIQKGRQSDF